MDPEEGARPFGLRAHPFGGAEYQLQDMTVNLLPAGLRQETAAGSFIQF
jgi:hypothetical protein